MEGRRRERGEEEGGRGGEGGGVAGFLTPIAGQESN